jgi:hypothetical protein
MAVTIVSNKARTSAVIHVTSANATLKITGNTTTSNLASPGETLTGAYITQAAWGCDPQGYIIIKRDDTPVAFYDSTGQHEYAGCGMPITALQTAANLSVEFVSSSNCFIIFELQKVGPIPGPSDYFQT